MILKIEGKTALLQTRATPAVLAVATRLEGRRFWLNGGGLRVENTQHNIDVLCTIPGVTLERPGAAQEDVSEFDLGGGTYEPRTAPYDHQNRLSARIGARPTFGLFMEQGTGKTKSLIDWAGRLHAAGKITGVLVVSKKGVHRQWIESELMTHGQPSWVGRYWPKAKDMASALAPEGKLKWFAINYDSMKVNAGFEACLLFCKMHQGKLFIIADESQEIKNYDSARSKAIMQLKPYSSHRALATGTPIAKDLTDEWAQLRWMNEGILGQRYISAFRAEYCIMGGFENRAVIASKNVAQFRERTDPWMFRVTKEEIGILPKQYNTWGFDLTKRQLGMIKEIRSELKLLLDSGQTVKAETGATMLGKIQQITSGFLIHEDRVVERLMPITDNPRALAAIEWLGADEKAKAIIWFRFREDARIMAELLDWNDYHFVEYHGGVSDADRKKAIDSFMDVNGAQVFLANPQSAGTGLNLQGLCNRALYYTNSFNSIDRWQSEDRIHRIGTKGIVTYTDLIGKGSIDRRIVANLKKKKGISEMAIGDIASFLEGEDEFEMLHGRGGE